MTYRILSMDGGNGLAISRMLHEVQKTLAPEQSDLLGQVDLFAGTSFGGLSALFLAMHDDPSSAVPQLTEFCGAIYENLLRGVSVPRLLTAIAGQSALESTDRLREFLIGQYGATTRLGDLKHKVMIVSFQLDNGQPEDSRSWAPHIYTNFPADVVDCNELVVDVAMRTSAVPIVNPIYQSMAGTGPGYIDGGVVANNPAMCALAQALNHQPRKEIKLLSIGIGRSILGNTLFLNPKMAGGVASWGYGRWLLNPSEPLLLLDMFFEGDTAAVDWQCRELLDQQYHRLSPPKIQQFRALDLECEKEVQEAVSWLGSSGWMGQDQTPN